MNSREIFSVSGIRGKVWHSFIRLGPATRPSTTFFTFTLNPRQNKTMKTRMTSNLRPLLHAFYPFLIGIVVLWAMPRNARAQVLYGSRD